MFLISLELGGRLHMPAMPHMRVSWKIPVLAILAVLFVVPHDPSSRVQHVGSSGFRVPAPMSALRSRFASKGRTSAPPAPSVRAARAAQPQLLFGLLSAQEAQSRQGQLLDVLPAQLLSERQLRELRVARWRAQRLLQASSRAVDVWGGDVWGSWGSGASLAPTDAHAVDPLAAYHAAAANASLVATSVDELRQLHGARQRWYGDLDWVGTRQLYHSLLPTHLVEDEALPLAQRARMAVSARRAARLYARERALLPLCTGSMLFDGLRHLRDHGTFQPDGLSELEIFSKYAEQLGVPPPDWSGDADDGDAYTDFYLTVLRKSCSTNPRVDSVTDALAQGVALGTGVGGGMEAVREAAESVVSMCNGVLGAS